MVNLQVDIFLKSRFNFTIYLGKTFIGILFRRLCRKCRISNHFHFFFLFQKAPSLDLETTKDISKYILENGTVSGHDDREITIPYIGTYIINRYLSRFFDFWAHETMYAYIGNKHFFTKSCRCQTYQNSKIS